MKGIQVPSVFNTSSMDISKSLTKPSAQGNITSCVACYAYNSGPFTFSVLPVPGAAGGLHLTMSIADVSSARLPFPSGHSLLIPPLHSSIIHSGDPDSPSSPTS